MPAAHRNTGSPGWPQVGRLQVEGSRAQGVGFGTQGFGLGDVSNFGFGPSGLGV